MYSLVDSSLKKDYFYLEIDNSRFSYILDINSKNAFMDIPKTISHFKTRQAD